MVAAVEHQRLSEPLSAARSHSRDRAPRDRIVEQSAVSGSSLGLRVTRSIKLLDLHGDDVFDADAVVLLHEATPGAMRDLDRLAGAALRETARQKRKLDERAVGACDARE